jgi:hypothetical protein
MTQGPPTPTTERVSVARFGSYADAQHAVDHLADQRFPVQTVQIVGTDLRMVEQVYGRLGWGRAAAMGAASGAWAGVFVGFLLGLFAPGPRGVVALVLWGLLLGAVFGAAFGLAGYASSGGRRDFVSRSRIVPHQFELMVEASHAEQARQVLAGPR